MNDNGEHRTSDLYFAAYLKVAGVSFKETEREGRRVFFVFEDVDRSVLRDLKNGYFNRTAKVPALSFADEIKTMKQLTHES